MLVPSMCWITTLIVEIDENPHFDQGKQQMMSNLAILLRHSRRTTTLALIAKPVAEDNAESTIHQNHFPRPFIMNPFSALPNLKEFSMELELHTPLSQSSSDNAIIEELRFVADVYRLATLLLGPNMEAWDHIKCNNNSLWPDRVFSVVRSLVFKQVGDEASSYTRIWE